MIVGLIAMILIGHFREVEFIDKHTGIISSLIITVFLTVYGIFSKQQNDYKKLDDERLKQIARYEERYNELKDLVIHSISHNFLDQSNALFNYFEHHQESDKIADEGVFLYYRSKEGSLYHWRKIIVNIPDSSHRTTRVIKYKINKPSIEQDIAKDLINYKLTFYSLGSDLMIGVNQCLDHFEKATMVFRFPDGANLNHLTSEVAGIYYQKNWNADYDWSPVLISREELVESDLNIYFENTNSYQELEGIWRERNVKKNCLDFPDKRQRQNNQNLNVLASQDEFFKHLTRVTLDATHVYTNMFSKAPSNLGSDADHYFSSIEERILKNGYRKFQRIASVGQPTGAPDCNSKLKAKWLLESLIKFHHIEGFSLGYIIVDGGETLNSIHTCISENGKSVTTWPTMQTQVEGGAYCVYDDKLADLMRVEAERHFDTVYSLKRGPDIQWENAQKLIDHCNIDNKYLKSMGYTKIKKELTRQRN